MELPLALGTIGLVRAGIGFACPGQPDRSGRELAIAEVVLGVIAIITGIVGAVALNDVVQSVAP